MSLISKVKYYLKLKKYFGNIRDFLADGYYVVDDKKIEQLGEQKVSRFKRFKVKSYGTKLYGYKKGSLFFTQYKSGLLTEDTAFYFITNKTRYEEYKKHYELYKARLMYPSIDLKFVDEKKLVIAPIVNGQLIKDESRFEIFLKNIFDLAKSSKFEMKSSMCTNSKIELPWYVQHGDCKNANIIWSKEGNKFTMIDLEAIDLYPPLYDAFYYLFITKKEASVSILKSKSFEGQIKSFYSNLFDVVPDNILDITLANYASYTSSKLVKGSDLYEFEFYLYWRKYDSFKEFPLTQKVLKEYEQKLKEYKIR